MAATDLGKLVRGTALTPALPKKPTVAQKADRAERIEFLLRRGRLALADPAHASWRAPGGKVSAAGVPLLTAQLKTEVTDAAAKMATLRKDMADASKTELVGIDDASVDPLKRIRRRNESLLERTPQQLRDTAIISAGWHTLIENPAIGDADLHTLVSRRLMVTERMIWYVGRGGEPSWSDFTAGKEWLDSWNRMFEYPRLPKGRPLDGLCKPSGADKHCDPAGPMKGWRLRVGRRYQHALQLNPTVSPRWTPANVFFFNKASGDPARAVTDLFIASKRFDQRNMLMCDHVIQCLHLEALTRVKSKRDGSTSWLKAITDVESDGWLRIVHPSMVDDFPGGVAFLVAETEPRFFRRRKIGTSDLQVGDHIIVFNHPAYDMAKEAVDVWRLENAVVVTTTPRLMLQGHGTNPLPFTSTRTVPGKDKETLEPSMRLNMLTLFNKKLRQLRKAALAENKKGAPRTEINDFDSRAVLVQRTNLGTYSGYDPDQFGPAVKPLARWWIRWDQDDEKREKTIAADADWARQTWDKHRVELLDGFGFFPLWLPRTNRSGIAVMKGGKISALKEVTVSQNMASGWSWYYDKDEDPANDAPHRVAARRPKVS